MWEPREAGRLGIINIKLFNLALLSKWIWQLGSNKGGLWKEVLESKYGRMEKLEKGWVKQQRFPFVDRFEGNLEVGGLGRSFEDRFVWEVGNGKSIKFWED